MTLLLTVLIGLGAALVSSGVTYLIARQTHSGKVETTDASTLWEASEEIRKELRADLVVVREEMVVLRAEHVQCRQELADINNQLRVMRKRMKEQES